MNSNENNTVEKAVKEFSIWGQFKDTVRYKYSSFSGRASRKEYWSFAFIGFWITLLADAIDTIIQFKLGIYGIVGFLVWFALFIPNITVTIRRLHDVNRSGWYILLLYLPIGLGSSLYLFDISIFELFNNKKHAAIVTFALFYIIVAIELIMLYLLVKPTQPNDNQYGPSLLNHEE
ncbi:DUF805 domain-containing protein [Veillonella agrestimuris]|uniref:DUF805 domain-containing protein n=1 Tax=Veillonella agrestimuris TaxID=2941340 RepID=UPI00203FE171|nr:DUF805 domain-containing protein [Veillonella agrestimuris]